MKRGVKLMIFLPKRQQWKTWSLPSKLTAIGASLGAFGIFLSILLFLLPYVWPVKPVERRTDELIALFDFRANRIRNELKPYYQYAEISNFIDRVNDLHAKHVAALRAGDLILAHEVLIEIHELSFDLERSEFWKRHDAENPEVHYEFNFFAFRRGPMISLYTTGRIKSEETNFIYVSTKGDQLKEAIKIYEHVLNAQ